MLDPAMIQLMLISSTKPSNRTSSNEMKSIINSEVANMSAEREWGRTAFPRGQWCFEGGVWLCARAVIEGEGVTELSLAVMVAMMVVKFVKCIDVFATLAVQCQLICLAEMFRPSEWSDSIAIWSARQHITVIVVLHHFSLIFTHCLWCSVID